jgi:hypothetical protein
LFVQRVKFLLGKLAFAFGFLNGAEDAVEIAHNGLEAVADAIDLAADNAIEISVAFVATAAAVSSAIPVAGRAAIVTTVACNAVARSLAVVAARWFAVGGGAPFMKFIRFVRFVGGDFGHAFALGRIVDCWWNVFVFVSRAVFRLAIIVISRPCIFAIRGIFGVTFARGSIVIARRSCCGASSPGAAATSTCGTATATAATTPAAFAITAVTGFAARTIRIRAGRADGAFRELRFGVRLIGSGRRGRRRFPIVKRGLSRRFGGAFRAS